ncbi:MAG: hypothetical protein IJX14_00740 [Clostridia bacterium]|nr:hypothetical protein [Clostridia bacterium]
MWDGAEKERYVTGTEIVGSCGRCGEEILEGDFCYRIGDGYWCRECVSRAAVIAADFERRRSGRSLPVCGQRLCGRYREREIGLSVPDGMRKGW